MNQLRYNNAQCGIVIRKLTTKVKNVNITYQCYLRPSTKAMFSNESMAQTVIRYSAALDGRTCPPDRGAGDNAHEAFSAR